MARKLKTINRTGLVGEWLLNGNALDTSGSGNNGTATNVTYTGTDRGYQSQCGSFNGSSSKIAISNNAALQLTSNQSYNFWLKMSGQPGTGLQYRIWDNNGGSSPYGMYISYRDTAGVKDITMAYGAGILSSSNSYPLTNGIWYMITCIHDDTNNTDSIYGNGVLLNSATGKTSNPASKSNSQYIGVEDGIRKWFNGSIELMRIYNRVLSSEEISDLYKEGLRYLGGQSYGTLFDGLVAMYDFNGDVQDIVGGYNLTNNGATLTTDRFGISNKAYSFDGINDYMAVADPAGLDFLTGDFTMLFYWKPTTLAPYMVICSKYNNSPTNNGFQFRTDSVGTELFFWTYDGNTSSLTTPTGCFTNGVGAFYALTRTSGVLRVYKNGEIFATSGALTARNINNAYELSIGSTYLTIQGTRSGYISGELNEILFFNVAKSADEVKTLYQLSSTRYLLPN